MSSLFASALARLDESLQTIQTQNRHLRVGNEPDEEQLRRSLLDACRQTVVLSDLIIVQRRSVSEVSHGALDQLLHELTTLRQTQRRGLKLLRLALELQAGRVSHPRLRRTEALNELRHHAVRELLECATDPSLESDLPGPKAGKWLHWARNLQENADAEILQTLRRDYPALEEFIAEMDDRYWVSGENQATALFPEEEEEAIEEPAAERVAVPIRELSHAERADHDRLARDLIAMFEKALHGDRGEAASRSHELPSGTALTTLQRRAPTNPESRSSRTRTGKNDLKATSGWLVPGNEVRPMGQRPGRIERKRSDKTAAHDFMRVVNAWQLDDGQARQLLEVPRALFHKIRDGEHVTLSPENLTRISLLVAISKGLTVLYGTRRGERWIHRPNSKPPFEGSEPLKYILKEGIDGLVKVRQLVGVWSGYITPGGKG